MKASTTKTYWKEILSLSAGLALLAGCGQQDDETTDSAYVPQAAQGPEAGAIAPDPHDPEALSPPQLSRTASDAIPEADGGDEPLSGVGDIASDEQQEALQQRIREGLASSEDVGLAEDDLDQIEIEVREGVIELSGEVPSEEVARTVGERVREISGVQEVNNNLVASR